LPPCSTLFATKLLLADCDASAYPLPLLPDFFTHGFITPTAPADDGPAAKAIFYNGHAVDTA
jgi:hypothetical protein